MNQSPELDLVYGDCGDDRFAFLTRTDALERSRLIASLRSPGATWGDVRAATPTGYARLIAPMMELEWAELLEKARLTFGTDDPTLSQLREFERHRTWMGPEPPDSTAVEPSWRDPYTRNSISLPLPFSEMQLWLPESVKRLGTYASSMFYDGLEYDESSAPKAARRLRKLGYKCTRNDSLVQAAFGM